MVMMFRAEEWGWREHDSNPCLGIRKNPRNHVARFLDTDTSWRGWAVPLKPARLAGPRRSPRSAYWRSPDVDGAKCSIFAGSTLAETIQLVMARPARALCRPARQPGHILTSCQESAARPLSCHHGKLRSPRRRVPRRGSGENRKHHRRGHGKQGRYVGGRHRDMQGVPALCVRFAARSLRGRRQPGSRNES